MLIFSNQLSSAHKFHFLEKKVIFNETSPSYEKEDTFTPLETQEMVNSVLRESIKKQSELKENIDIPMDTADAIKVLRNLQKNGLVLRMNNSNILETLAVQHLLAEIGVFNKNRDGLFGVETRDAVIKFQGAGVSDAQIETWKKDGIVGKDTIAMLLEAVSDSPEEINKPEEGISFEEGAGPVVINVIDGKEIKYFRNDEDSLYYTNKTQKIESIKSETVE
ncbi:TPA: peptidoglycan-binding protein, partial [Candidatus Gracilibacteria bacterium]|nr:peptidoglycan-binding protein [Candidatus Gracilibacteria bacterium]